MYAKIQGSGTIFRVSFALSKTPHLHRAYLVTVCKQKSMTLDLYLPICPLSAAKCKGVSAKCPLGFLLFTSLRMSLKMDECPLSATACKSVSSYRPRKEIYF